MKHIPLILGLTVGGVLPFHSVGADTVIPVANASFESPVTVSWTDGNPTGWLGSGVGGHGCGIQTAATASMVGVDGSQLGFCNNYGWMGQTNLTTLTLGETYTLTVSIGDRSTYASSLCAIYLRTGGTNLAFLKFNPADDNTMADYSISYTATATDAGKPLDFYLGNEGGNQTSFDNVRLTSVPVPTARQIAWRGNASAVWDIATAVNWSLDGTAVNYLDGDSVLFNDDATGTTDITLDTAVAPAAVTFANTNKDYTISGTAAITGNIGITKDGPGKVTLNNPNAHIGASAVNQGTLAVTNLAAYRSSSAIATDATFEANVATNVSASNSFNLTGAGTFVKTGAGNWQIGDVGRVGISMSAGGLIDIREGSVSVGNHQQSFTDNQGSLNVATGASLDLAAENAPFDALTGGGEIANSYPPSGGKTVTLGVANGGGTFSGVIGSPGLIALAKTGTGTQILTGTNTYTLGTTISGGTLQLGEGSTSGSLSTSSDITNNGTLAFNRSDTVTQGVHFSGNAITGTGGITQMGSGTLILTANNTCSGAATITGGTLQLGTGSTSGALSSSSMITNNGTLAFNRSDNISSGAIGGTGGLTQIGPGTLTLPAANTYTGTTTVNGGKLVINGSLAATAVNVNATGTLGGRGTVGGAISVNDGGTLASGASPGLTTTANVTFTTGSTFAVEINSDSNTADTLTAGGDLTLGNATLAVSNPGTAPIANGSRFVIATYTGNLSGTFSGIPDGGTITVGTTNLTVRYADAGKNITLSLSTPFSKWLSDNYPSLAGDAALPDSDPDGDGLNNIGEFAFKGDPTKGGDRGLTAVLAIDANGNTTRELTLTVAVRSGATFVGTPSPAATIDGVTYTAQGSLDLANAFAAPVTELTPALTPAQTGLPDITGSGWQYHTFVLTGSEGLPSKGFLRVQAEGQ